MLPDYTPAASQKTAKRFDIPESASNKGKAKASTSKKEASDPISKPAQEQPSKEVIDALEEADQIPSQVDYQIADLIDLMDDNRAAIVRKALEKGAL